MILAKSLVALITSDISGSFFLFKGVGSVIINILQFFNFLYSLVKRSFFFFNSFLECSLFLSCPLVNSITLFLSLSNAVTLKNFDKLIARGKPTYPTPIIPISF